MKALKGRIHVRDSRGFVLISTLILLPLFLTLVLGLGVWVVFLKHFKEVQHQCRLGNLKTQEVLLKGVEKLGKMNPQAQRLRLASQRAQQKVAATAATGVGLPAAMAHLALVKQRQLRLAHKQQLLIRTTELEANRVLNETRFQMMKTSKKLMADYLGRLGSSNLKVKSLPVQMQISRTPSFSLTPDYHPQEDFEKKQDILIRWTWISQIHQELPFLGWLAPGLRLNHSCQTQPEQRRSRWVPALRQAKF
jgi:hypothetical protein